MIIILFFFSSMFFNIHFLISISMAQNPDFYEFYRHKLHRLAWLSTKSASNPRHFYLKYISFVSDKLIRQLKSVIGICRWYWICFCVINIELEVFTYHRSLLKCSELGVHFYITASKFLSNLDPSWNQNVGTTCGSSSAPVKKSCYL